MLYWKEECYGREEIIIILPESPTDTLPEDKAELPIREAQAVRAEGLSIGCSSITKMTRGAALGFKSTVTEFIYLEGLDHEWLGLKAQRNPIPVGSFLPQDTRRQQSTWERNASINFSSVSLYC